MLISSSQLLIKPWSLDHTAMLFELTQDEGFNLFPITIYRQKDLASSVAWIQEMEQIYQNTGLGKWSVWNKESEELIGLGGLTPWRLGNEDLIDITYRLKKSAWGCGYGLELAEALVDYGFKERKLDQITATITPDNASSIRIAEKIGMKFDQRITLLGVETDLYRLTNPI